MLPLSPLQRYPTIVIPRDTAFMDLEIQADSQGLMTIDMVQNVLNRSRATVYRYANTDKDRINLPYDPDRLNPEYRRDKREALLFHPNEVARFARDVLNIKSVTIAVQPPPVNITQELLQGILRELEGIRILLTEIKETR